MRIHIYICFEQVADDPETLRIKQNTKIISNIAYHGDLEKKAAMEKQREAAEIADVRGMWCLWPFANKKQCVIYLFTIMKSVHPALRLKLIHSYLLALFSLMYKIKLFH